MTADARASYAAAAADADLNPVVTQLQEGIFQIAGGKAGSCSVYLLKGTRKNVLIDTGLPQDFPNLCAGLAEIGLTLADVHLVILTHEHADHAGASCLFPPQIVIGAHSRAATKLRLEDHFSMMAGVFGVGEGSFHVDLLLEDGIQIDIGGFRLRTVYTPGHCSGAICLIETQRGILFSGDTIFAGGVLGGIFASGNISDYIDSLERLRDFRLTAIYAGHGKASTDPYSDLARAIDGARQLMGDTQMLFETIDAKSSFDRLLSATRDYSRKAAERRTDHRISGGLTVLVRMEDADHVVALKNISLSGACLDRRLAVAVGSHISLALDTIGTIEAHVVNDHDGYTHLRFPRDYACRAALAEFIAAAKAGAGRKPR